MRPSQATRESESAVLIVAPTIMQFRGDTGEHIVTRCVRCRWKLLVHPVALASTKRINPIARVDISCFDCASELEYDNIDEEAKEAFRRIAREVGPKNGRRARS